MNFKEIEKKWNSHWNITKAYSVQNDDTKPKYYCLDMFPYPSGSGLHVGHPLGYIATDIICRFKRLQGFNVLHAMGFDSFGLPAEQYAIETGQHPKKTTTQNILMFKSQLDKMGLSLDPDREIITSSPEYYKWTQWIFCQLFNSWFDYNENIAKPISILKTLFEEDGSNNINSTGLTQFSNFEWLEFNEKKKSDILMEYRLAYLSSALVNWCPDLGTVLANDEVIDGFSERGGFPVERKKMKQWMLRITAYSDRLLNNLNKLDWPLSLKEIQKNWIGKSSGWSINFQICESKNHIEIFTTKIETIHGVTFLLVSPESTFLDNLITPDYLDIVTEFLTKNASRSERERLSDVQNVNGVFTGSWAINPINGKKIPIWISDYVIATYGTGAVMGVPAHDDRDLRFANKYNLEKLIVINKLGLLINSLEFNGMDCLLGQQAIFNKLSTIEICKEKVVYKMRDAIFGRQRYWGEPIPIYYDNDIPKIIPESDLPLVLPEIDNYKPTQTGQPPLGHAKNWLYKNQYPYELSTMPGWAGSSWYFLRYMDPNCQTKIVSQNASNYWKNVDLYMGGNEHATGHLLYSRFWNMFLYDLDCIPFEEPFNRIVNQGMIESNSALIHRITGKNTYVSEDISSNFSTSKVHISTDLVNKSIVNLDKLRSWREDFLDAEFIFNDNFYCEYKLEKMSKSKHNVTNPNDIIEMYGADVFRMYEMYLGPITQSKAWSVNGIDGIRRFLNRFISLYQTEEGTSKVTDEIATQLELEILHSTLKKVSEDIEALNYNTAITALMICVNKLIKNQCHKNEILTPLAIIASPFIVYTTQEIWTKTLKKTGNIFDQSLPVVNNNFLKKEIYDYPITINGKVRTNMAINLNISEEEIAQLVLENKLIKKWIDQKTVKKIIFVKNKIINIVI
ncbi:leucine--tRNA ligase [Wohlfahrtiimonas chitiniclastica]|uniref:leucine--tRNA ligase n=1 Tax=Wohlfahrtiimonas chitiniclastica TaxID=400946 RepID=UPI000B9869BD|nr:leucine--tRNA ligase [Wohlfahrtiimonas chitiniclastica]OYQ77499.1 leucine--tRNA ligase [Wohlfahrtiimonas chitiniclastica]